MPPRHPAPRLWLMTDERQGAGLWTALARLPRGAGVIFRHYRTARGERRALFEKVRVIARRRRLALLLAGTPREAIGWKADGAHGRSPHRRLARALLRTAPAHNRCELVTARRMGVDLILLSPVWPTRSHPGGRALGPTRFGLLARSAGGAVIALGGLNARRFRHLKSLGAYGWAAIDAWGEAAESAPLSARPEPLRHSRESGNPRTAARQSLDNRIHRFPLSRE